MQYSKEERFEKIVVLQNEVQARLLDAALKERDIPHMLRSYHDSAYDGLFQGARGWGHVEAPERYRDTIHEILDGLEEGDA